MLNLALLEQRSQRFSECFAWCDKALRCALHIPAHRQIECRNAVASGNALLLSTVAAFAKVLPLARFDTRHTFCSKRRQRAAMHGFMMGACRAMRREEEDHPKALYRRGTTHALLGNFEEAARDLARASLPDLPCAVPSDGTVGMQQAYTFPQATRAGPCLGVKIGDKLSRLRMH